MYPEKKPPEEKPVYPPPQPPVCPPPQPPVCPPKPPPCCSPKPEPCCQQEMYCCHPQMMLYCQPQPMLHCERQSAYPPSAEDYEGYDPYAYAPYGSEAMYGYQGIHQGNPMPMYDPAYMGHYGGGFETAAVDMVSAGEPGGIPYVVKQGDTVYTIAQAHGVMWQDLMSYNHLDNSQGLYVGQQLLIPRAGF